MDARPRKNARKPPAVRLFEPLKAVNFEAESYDDFMDWSKTEFEPPMTMDLKDHELELCKEDWNPCKTKNKPFIPAIPLHTQPVEREIKLK